MLASVLVSLTLAATASTPTATATVRLPALAPADTTALSWCDSTVAVDTVPLPGATGAHQTTVVACSGTSADSLRLRRAITRVTQAISVYTRLTGVPYPGPRYVMHFSPGNDGARTNGGSFVSFVLSLPDPRAESDRPAATAKILAHELAHQWGPRIKGPDTGWLGEGFADFLTAQVWGATAGARGEEEFLFFYNTQWDDSYRTAPAVGDLRTVQWGWPVGWFSIPWPGAAIWAQSIDQDAYYRGALVLWMLQQYLGDARFWAVMHAYLTMPAGDDANATFLRAIQTVTGEDLRWFFQAWVHGQGYPQVTVAATYDAAAQRVTLHVTQHVTHDTASVFRMPVTIRVGTAAGDVLSNAIIEASTQTLVVDHVQQPPTFVVFDDGDAIVKTLVFPQPTAWLVAQLHRESRPWQTGWVIAQLQPRAAAGDATAQDALVTAALSARYALTRAQALVALGALQAEKATQAATVLATFTHGVADTAVMVRRAAIQGLARSGTSAAVTVLERVVAHDASDLVRADALQSLLLYPATSASERHALFAQALQEPPGYQDIVLFSAIKALSLTGQCDTALVTMVHNALRQPGMTARLQSVTDQLSAALTNVGPSADPTCVQTFAAVLPLPGAAP